MGEIALRPYQTEFIDNVRNQFRRGKRRVVGVAPCGAGKTIMTGWIIRQVCRNNKSAVFFVHRKELIEQTAATFDKLGIRYGIIAGGVKPNYLYPVQIASVQTLINRLDFVPAPDLLVCDECHHILAKTYLQIINRWNKSYLLGVTATPERTGGVKLCDVFNSMVLAPSTAELIKLGNLTQFDYFAADSSNDFSSELNSIKILQGDYDNKQLAELMSRRRIIGNIVEHYEIHSPDKSAICYCVNVAHSKTVAQSFQNAGINAVQVDGSTPKNKREFIVNQFRKGNIQVLCNAELFGEGFDVPNCDAVILARPTKSLTLHIQQSMRSMRPNPADPNKRAIIIDCVENWKRHGLPDTERDWNLDPNDPKREGKTPYKECPECERIIPLGTRVCPFCDYEFEFRTMPEEVDGNASLLHNSEHKKSVDTAPKVINKPTTIEEFLPIAEKKGYERGWAAFKALEHVHSYADCLHISEVMNYKKGWAWHKWEELKKDLQKAPAFDTI